jgi:hypothetical protein
MRKQDGGHGAQGRAFAHPRPLFVIPDRRRGTSGRRNRSGILDLSASQTVWSPPAEAMPTKNTPPEQAKEKPPSRDEERRQVVQEYADDQREIIKKLRKVIGKLSRFGTFSS